jgi:arabinogalactan oligomer/maltooligosaccharide transport system permease protein
MPAMLVIALTIVYPFFYNVVLSFSNMSLRNFDDWQVTGFQNYVQVLSEWKFFEILIKTLVWTGVCVFFHITIGLLLAACLNGPVAGKTIYRIILILPWAVPAYITALTWRGMFNYEYGAVNLILTQWCGFSEGLNWLGEEFLAFAACIITNVWLGFPFMMIIALGGMQGIPTELYEAARIDRLVDRSPPSGNRRGVFFCALSHRCRAAPACGDSRAPARRCAPVPTCCRRDCR